MMNELMLNEQQKNGGAMQNKRMQRRKTLAKTMSAKTRAEYAKIPGRGKYLEDVGLEIHENPNILILQKQ